MLEPRTDNPQVQGIIITLPKDGGDKYGVSNPQGAKDVVASEAGRRWAPPPRCSSLVATFGFMWSCYQRAKDTGSTGGDPTYLVFPVDHGSWMNPPVPDEYLGNCVSGAIHVAPMDKLAEPGTGGLFVTCTAVAASIDEVVRGIRSADTIELWLDRFREAAVGGMWTVIGSPRFGVYDVDFGFRRPAKVEIVSMARTDVMAVVEGRSSAGGGIEVGISLPEASVQSFQNCFQDAIHGLHHR